MVASLSCAELGIASQPKLDLGYEWFHSLRVCVRSRIPPKVINVKDLHVICQFYRVLGLRVSSIYNPALTRRLHYEDFDLRNLQLKRFPITDFLQI